MRAAALLLAAAFAATVSADDVPRICPACDHEVAYDEAFCHNCGGDLSGVPVPGAPAEAEPEPEMPGAGAVAEAIRADVAFARGKHGPFAALAALRDAVALSRADPSAIPAKARAELLKRKEEFFASCSREVATCPLCHGKGTLPRKPPPKRPPAAKGTLEESLPEVPSKPKPYVCGLCGGHGKAPRIRDRRALADAMRLGAREFRLAAEAGGREDRGGTFLPPAWYKSLSADEKARVDRAGAADCASCAGTGTVPCRTCGGFGRVACRDAEAHATPKPVALKSQRGTRIEDYQYEHELAAASRACPACGGTWDAPGAVACPDCGGKGLAACTSCGGTGHGR